MLRQLEIMSLGQFLKGGGEKKMTFSSEEIEIFTDGSCYGTVGPGGWAALIISGNKKLEISGRENKTTNNRMEMLAVIKGLSILKKRSNIKVYTDSGFIVDVIEKKIINRWRTNGWRASGKKRVANKDLWQKIIPLCKYHNIKFHHVKSHSGHTFNERCDQSAKAEAIKLKREYELEIQRGEVNANV